MAPSVKAHRDNISGYFRLVHSNMLWSKSRSESRSDPGWWALTWAGEMEQMASLEMEASSLAHEGPEGKLRTREKGNFHNMHYCLSDLVLVESDTTYQQWVLNTGRHYPPETQRGQCCYYNINYIIKWVINAHGRTWNLHLMWTHNEKVDKQSQSPVLHLDPDIHLKGKKNTLQYKKLFDLSKSLFMDFHGYQ